MKILITGIPGTGKTTIGNYLQSAKGFEHLDIEAALKRHDVVGAKIIQDFMDSPSKNKVITWGFIPETDDFGVRQLLDLGYKMIWFDGNRDAARKAFLRRGDVPIIALDNQMAKIQSFDLDKFKPKHINTFQKNGVFLEKEAIVELILKDIETNLMSTLKLEKFVEPSDPVLMRVAEPVGIEDFKSKEIMAHIDQMFEVAFGEQKDSGKPLLVGLAAPQIGISKRIILVDVIADGKGKVGDLRLYINPEIIWSSEENGEWYEGCFSTSRVCGIVSRPVKIKIRAYTKEGKVVEEEYSDYTARIFQHEIDHLNGKEFTTHITDPDKLHWVEKEEFPKYRNEQKWKTWPNKCPRDKWDKIKRGY